jgi:hypothetical protein
VIGALEKKNTLDCDTLGLNQAGSVTVLIYCSTNAPGTAVTVTGYEEIFQSKPCYLSCPLLLKARLSNIFSCLFLPKMNLLKHERNIKFHTRFRWYRFKKKKKSKSIVCLVNSIC